MDKEVMTNATLVRCPRGAFALGRKAKEENGTPNPWNGVMQRRCESVDAVENREGPVPQAEICDGAKGTGGAFIAESTGRGATGLKRLPSTHWPMMEFQLDAPDHVPAGNTPASDSCRRA